MTVMVYADDIGQATIEWKHAQLLVNTSLLKFICKGILLCKLTCLVIYRLTLNMSDMRQTSAILNIDIYRKQWPSISPISTTSYEMAWSLSSVVTFHRSVQHNLNADVNWTMKYSQKKVKACSKQKGIRWCQQLNKPGGIGKNRASLARKLWTETNYLKYTTSVSSYNLEQVTLTKYPNQNTYKRDNANIAC